MIGKSEVKRFIAEGMYADATAAMYQRVLYLFIEHAKIDKRGWEARAVAFRDITNCGTYGKATRIAIARSFLRWCQDEGLIDKNPLRRVRIRVPSRSGRSVLTDAEVKAVLSTILKLAKSATGTEREYLIRDRAAIVLMLHTALRIGSVITIDVEDFQHNGDTAAVRYRSKGSIGKDSTAYVQKSPRAVLDQYLSVTGRSWESRGALFRNKRGKRISHSGLLKSIRRRFDAAGIRAEISPHWLRHTAATNAFKHGADLKAVQKMLDHKSLVTTDKYLHSFIDVENSAEGKIDYS